MVSGTRVMHVLHTRRQRRATCVTSHWTNHVFPLPIEYLHAVIILLPVMIRPATAADTATICELIQALAEYEHLSHEVVLDPDQVREHLFGPRPYAEVLIA